MIQDKDGRWLLEENDLGIGPDDMLIDDSWNTISTYLETWFDVDKRFGTSTRDSDDYINLYAIYKPRTRKLEVIYFIHYADGNVSKEIEVKDLDFSEKEAMLSVMRREGLDELIQEMKSEALMYKFLGIWWKIKRLFKKARSNV